jgi:hypothetical protein
MTAAIGPGLERADGSRGAQSDRRPFAAFRFPSRHDRPHDFTEDPYSVRSRCPVVAGTLGNPRAGSPNPFERWGFPNAESPGGDAALRPDRGPDGGRLRAAGLRRAREAMKQEQQKEQEQPRGADDVDAESRWRGPRA